MVLPDRMSMVSVADLAAKLEKRFFESILLEIIDNSFSRYSVQQAKYLRHFALCVDKKVSMIGHYHIGQPQDPMPVAGFPICAAQDLFEFVSAEDRQPFVGDGS